MGNTPQFLPLMFISDNRKGYNMQKDDILNQNWSQFYNMSCLKLTTFTPLDYS